MRAQSRKEAELVVEEARGRAREIMHAAQDEREHVETEIRRLKAIENDMRAGYRAFLTSALERIEPDPGGAALSDQAA